MLVSDFDYNLPPQLIAQKPIRPRDHSRLLVLDRETGKREHRHFYDLPRYLKNGDLLVFNNTKVFKARLIGGIGDGKIEIFLLRPVERRGRKFSAPTTDWQCLAKPGKKLKVGSVVRFSTSLSCEVLEKQNDGVVIVRFNKTVKQVLAQANKIGHIPVPPYIKHEPKKLEDYQTIYAKTAGSVAAPTAGFHFTPRLIKQLKNMGVQMAYVTLHVGLGTFQPVKTEKVEDHVMHSEWVEISQKTADAINQAKADGRRVIAVGTTTVRALEGVAQHAARGTYHVTRQPTTNNNRTMEQLNNGVVIYRDKEINRDRVIIAGFSGDINLFITPGFQFKVVEGLITNFHLPKSTLLMLVSAFAGRESVLRAYEEAVKMKYKFFSFGDAMMIR